MKQGGIAQYKDYRHKLSKRSAHHRVKRSQQLLEAQRLLDSHNVDTNERQEHREKSELTYETDNQGVPRDQTNANFADYVNQNNVQVVTKKNVEHQKVPYKMSHESKSDVSNSLLKRGDRCNIDSSIQGYSTQEVFWGDKMKSNDEVDER